jgi:hypothetical protein
VLERALGRVYLLRGQAAIFSRGFGLMCDQFRQAGLWSEDLRCVGDRWVRQHLIADHEARRLRGPVIIVGHSCGGRYSLSIAEKLHPLGITIDLLIGVDVAMPYPVPDNVRRAVHLFRSHRRIYPARPMRLAPGSAATIENVDLDAADSPINPNGLYHLNITTSTAIQEWIVRRVLEVAAIPSQS